jgi:hypothetical protein
MCPALDPFIISDDVDERRKCQISAGGLGNRFRYDQARRTPLYGESIALHRGIAARQFRRTFVLADGIEVVAAELNHGLLNIDLERPEPAMQVRKVEIKTGSRVRTNKTYVGAGIRRTKNKFVE